MDDWKSSPSLGELLGPLVSYSTLTFSLVVSPFVNVGLPLKLFTDSQCLAYLGPTFCYPLRPAPLA